MILYFVVKLLVRMSLDSEYWLIRFRDNIDTNVPVNSALKKKKIPPKNLLPMLHSFYKFSSVFFPRSPAHRGQSRFLSHWVIHTHFVLFCFFLFPHWRGSRLNPSHVLWLQTTWPEHYSVRSHAGALVWVSLELFYSPWACSGSCFFKVFVWC